MNTDRRASWGTNTGDSAFFTMYDRFAREFQKQLKGYLFASNTRHSKHTFGQKSINFYRFFHTIYNFYRMQERHWGQTAALPIDAALSVRLYQG